MAKLISYKQESLDKWWNIRNMLNDVMVAAAQACGYCKKYLIINSGKEGCKKCPMDKVVCGNEQDGSLMRIFYRNIYEVADNAREIRDIIENDMKVKRVRDKKEKC